MSEETKDDALAHYSFLPWLRQGLASKISEEDNLGIGEEVNNERAKINISLKIKDDQNEISKDLYLFGPEDCLGLSPRAVVRTDPQNWVTDFEPNYLPSIEFYDEDLPWRYTPVQDNNGRLRPWICLIVVAEDEIKTFDEKSKPLPFVKLKDESQALPKSTEIWAWAHTHVNRDLIPEAGDGAIEGLERLESYLKENPDLGISRLLCPRKLKPNTAYYGMVIPTFEAGRLAGLGRDVPAVQNRLAPAWVEGAAPPDLPVYYHWYFRTGLRGDFEYLVRLLEARPLDKKIGIRDMDVQKPGLNVKGITNPPELGLEGALKTPQTESTVWNDRETFENSLSDEINLSETQQENETEGDPLVTPPLYGRWHAAVKKVDRSKKEEWIHELNLDPRHRTPAGFGTLVVQTGQEELMNQAWEQVEEINKANQLLFQAQLARAINHRLLEKHISPMNVERFFNLTTPVH